jgi:hypothetical protein
VLKHRDGTVLLMIGLPLAGIGVPWPWEWGIRENLIDAWHHVAYAAGTTLGYLALIHF